MGRRENQENSVCTCCWRDQDLHRRWYMVFVFVCMLILFTIYFLGYLSTVCFVQVRTQYVWHIQLSDRGQNGISLLGITGYLIIEVDGKYVMEMLLSAVPFGDVKHTGDDILRASSSNSLGMVLDSMSDRFLLQTTRLCWLTLCSRVNTWRWLTMIRTSRKPSNSSTEVFKFFDEGRNEYQIVDLWWQRSLHRWWRHIQETQVPYGG